MIYLNAANMKHLLVGMILWAIWSLEEFKNIQIHKIKWKAKPNSEEDYDLDKALQSVVLSCTELFGSNSYPTHRGTGLYLLAIRLFRICLSAHWHLKKEYLIYIWILSTYKPYNSKAIIEGEKTQGLEQLMWWIKTVAF